MTSREYRVAEWKVALWLAVPVLMTILSPLAVAATMTDGDSLVIVVWAFVTLGFWVYATVFLAYGADLDGDEIEFRYLARRRRARLSDIFRIDKSRSMLEEHSFIEITLVGGRVALFGRFNNWDAFLDEVKKANPDADVHPAARIAVFSKDPSDY